MLIEGSIVLLDALLEITYILRFLCQIMRIKSVLIRTTLVLLSWNWTISPLITISLHNSSFISSYLMWLYSFIIRYYTLFKLPLFNWIINECCLIVIRWLLGLEVLALELGVWNYCFLGWYLNLFISISHLDLIWFQLFYVCYLILLHLLELTWYWDWQFLLLALGLLLINLFGVCI